MTTTSRRPVESCPVAAILPELARVISLQAQLRAEADPDSDGDEGLPGRLSVLGDRQRALAAYAETGLALSLSGAAVQVLLANNAAADMGAALIGGDVACNWLDGRSSGELDRAADATTRSALAVLLANGAELPASVMEEYMPAQMAA